MGFTGEANLIVQIMDDFFIATQQSRHKLQVTTEPDVKQTVGFRFRSTTQKAVLLSAIQSENVNSLKVFWVSLHSCTSTSSHSIYLHSLIITL